MNGGEEECSFLLDLFDDSSGDGIFGLHPPSANPSVIINEERKRTVQYDVADSGNSTEGDDEPEDEDEDDGRTAEGTEEEDGGFASEEGADLDLDALDEMEENADFIARDLFSGGFCPEVFYSLFNCDPTSDDFDYRSLCPDRDGSGTGEVVCSSQYAPESQQQPKAEVDDNDDDPLASLDLDSLTSTSSVSSSSSVHFLDALAASAVPEHYNDPFVSRWSSSASCNDQYNSSKREEEELQLHPRENGCHAEQRFQGFTSDQNHQLQFFSSQYTPCSPSLSSSSGASPLNDEAYYSSSSSPGPSNAYAGLGHSSKQVKAEPGFPSSNVPKPRPGAKEKLPRQRIRTIIRKTCGNEGAVTSHRSVKERLREAVARFAASLRQTSPSPVPDGPLPTNVEELIAINRERAQSGGHSKCVRYIDPAIAAMIMRRHGPHFASVPPKNSASERGLPSSSPSALEAATSAGNPSLSSPTQQFKSSHEGAQMQTKSVRTYSRKNRELRLPPCQKPPESQLPDVKSEASLMLPPAGPKDLNLQPVDLTKIKKTTRGRACTNWTLVIDDRIELSRAEMKSQLSYTGDIVMKRPPVQKRKGRLPPGGVPPKVHLVRKTPAELMTAPGRRPNFMSRKIAKAFKRNLVIMPAGIDDFPIEGVANDEETKSVTIKQQVVVKEEVQREPVTVMPNPVMTSGLLEMAVAAAGLDEEE